MIVWTRNARFWVYARGGFVKLTLRPDETLHHGYSYDNGEGRSHEHTTWTHEGSHVEREYYSAASDCDGRHTRQDVAICRMGELAALSIDEPPSFMPRWLDKGGCQTDAFAEAMGY